MAEKKQIEVDLNIKSNVEPSVKQLQLLRKELKGAAAGSAEFNKISSQIRDVEDALQASKTQAQDFRGLLEETPGPIGQIAKGFKSLELNTKSFGTALKLSGIGLLVSLVGGLVAAFTNSEKAAKKLEPILIGFQKILGGIFNVFEPLLDIFVEMVEYVLPTFTKVVGGVYSGLFGLFTLIKDAGIGVGKILKGIFTGDFDSIKEGWDQLKGSIGNAVDSTVKAYERFEKGTEELTKKELEELEKRRLAEEEAAKKREEAAQKRLEEERKRFEAYQNLLKKYLDEEKDILAETDQQKLDLQKERAQKELDALVLTQEEKQKLQEQFDKVFLLKQQELDEKNEKLLQDRIKKEENYQLELQKLRASRTDTFEDDAKTEIDSVSRKYDELINLAIKNNESIITLEQLKLEEIDKIREDYNNKEKDRLDKINENQKRQLLDNVQAEFDAAQNKIQIRSMVVDAIAEIANQETAIAKAAFVAQQILRLQDLKATATAALKELAISQSKAGADTAVGLAATAKVGFPQNVPLLIAYAAQAAAIISSITKAFGAAKSTISSVESTGGETQQQQPIGVVARRNQGGFVFGDGGSITDSIPARLSNGEFVMNAKSASLFSPLLTAMNNMGNLPNTSLPQDMGNQSLIDVIDKTMSSRPIRTYVTANDMSNQQQFDRTIKSRSLI